MRPVPYAIETLLACHGPHLVPAIETLAASAVLMQASMYHVSELLLKANKEL